jgi:hypothetical protein
MPVEQFMEFAAQHDVPLHREHEQLNEGAEEILKETVPQLSGLSQAQRGRG